MLQSQVPSANVFRFVRPNVFAVLKIRRVVTGEPFAFSLIRIFSMNCKCEGRNKDGPSRVYKWYRYIYIYEIYDIYFQKIYIDVHGWYVAKVLYSMTGNRPSNHLQQCDAGKRYVTRQTRIRNSE